MKAKIQKNNYQKNPQDSKTIQLSKLSELSDQEAELVVGGWVSTGGSRSGTGGGSGSRGWNDSGITGQRNFGEFV
ncbi:hypothetical protein NIES37_34850 [Tolypothrix tenuis PCC 7101]|uniref:Bacteriocin-type signal sequence n=1 Tax=Tolypothrix tenuis PCC 7101 TaxID=231146 RepID=A0A1Z4N196_9CYAN|nr:hypothetical protein [Aulosira sp. FACHB-113]BAY99502.1 hypothetical protein NIES37_34850 [Tolypothrix tenuis PCC 7101]BAZ76576.1 hypothetical protein NIES50_51740 [Aulosira laxa NIES-50]